MIRRRLIINPIGGLANRMRSIASGISMSLALSDQEKVDTKFVWLKNWELNAEFNDIFMMPDILLGKIEYPSNLKYSLLYSIPRKKNLYVTSLTKRMYGAALYDMQDSYGNRFADGSGKGILSVVRESLSTGKPCYIQGGTTFYPFDITLYRNLFKPTTVISQQVKERLDLLGNCKIGIHIRRNDNIHSIQQSPDKLFIDKITEIIEIEPTARFYLATDDESVKRTFSRRFGSRIISSKSAANRSSIAGIKEAVVEMFTLAGTDRIYGSYYSSFSEAAAMLGQKPFEQLKL